jgi:hypothetical protein
MSRRYFCSVPVSLDGIMFPLEATRLSLAAAIMPGRKAMEERP